MYVSLWSSMIDYIEDFDEDCWFLSREGNPKDLILGKGN